VSCQPSLRDVGAYLNYQQSHKITEYLDEEPGAQTEEIDQEDLDQLGQAENQRLTNLERMKKSQHNISLDSLRRFRL
jgi:hypothetical protein